MTNAASVSQLLQEWEAYLAKIGPNAAGCDLGVFGSRLAAALRESEEANASLERTVADLDPLLREREGLRAERDALRAALQPFAALLHKHHGGLTDDQPIWAVNDATITAGDLRRAAAVLARVGTP